MESNEMALTEKLEEYIIKYTLTRVLEIIRDLEEKGDKQYDELKIIIKALINE